MKTLIMIALFLCLGVTEAAEHAPGNTEQNKPTSAPLVPYDSKQAYESFSKTVHGGIMHIVAKSADNASQVKLIQHYLQQTATEFNNGDFSSTERFHGPDMPGLAQMKSAKSGDIRYVYKALPNGGQIHISTEYSQLLTALHHWFDAQIKEHGNAPIPEHGQHHASPAE